MRNMKRKSNDDINDGIEAVGYAGAAITLILTLGIFALTYDFEAAKERKKAEKQAYQDAFLVVDSDIPLNNGAVLAKGARVSPEIAESDMVEFHANKALKLLANEGNSCDRMDYLRTRYPHYARTQYEVKCGKLEYYIRYEHNTIFPDGGWKTSLKVLD